MHQKNLLRKKYYQIRKKKYYVFVLALYISLLLGLFLGEDFLGGAAIDYRKILTNKLSIFKNKITVYGSTSSKIRLKNYTNIN